MATGAQVEPPAGTSRRRSPRFELHAAVDVTVLRSGVPDKLPGRTLNLCERGLAAVLAGEVSAGDAVAVELKLPEQAEPLRARATVRYQDKLRCGLEFVGLTPEQRIAIREWAKKSKAETDVSTSPKPEGEKEKETAEEQPKRSRSRRKGGMDPISRAPGGGKFGLRKILGVLLVGLVAIVAIFLWWRWNRSWEELESGLKSDESALVEKPQAQVPAEVMERLLIHRVEPTYPAEARRENLQGIIALDIIVGRDGSVVSMRPLNGPDVLARAAMDALRWWKFEPYRINGEAAVAETTVAVEFKR